MADKRRVNLLQLDPHHRVDCAAQYHTIPADGEPGAVRLAGLHYPGDVRQSATGIPDGQPKMLLAFFPAEYPLLNFAGTTAGVPASRPSAVASHTHTLPSP
jgi:hypothetical protein